MNQEDIVEWTRQAGGFEPTPAFLERFAALVAAAEREACANVCEVPDEYEDWEILGGPDGRAIMNELAAAIRARGQA